MGPKNVLDDLVLSTSKATAKALKAIKASSDLVEAATLATSGSGLLRTRVIPINCFPLEYLLGQNGIPLHRVVTIQGPTESSKSSMFWFLARIFLQNGGLVFYYDLENKHEPRTAKAYIGNPIAYRSRVYVRSVACAEDLSIHLQKLFAYIRQKKEMKGRPILIGIDTLGMALGAQYIANARQGKVNLGFSAAQTAVSQQSSLQAIVNLHLPKLPVTIVGMQQERAVLENPGEIKASGGRFSAYVKSLALRMQRMGGWKHLDEELPFLSVRQAKNSNNTKRNMGLLLPCDVAPSGLDIRSYSFQWGYAMLRLLSDISENAASYMDGIFKVEMPTKTTFAIKAKRGSVSKWAEKYSTKAVSYRDLGPALLADTELLDVLRVAMNLNIEPVFKTPYSLPVSLSGGLWIGPEEHADWDRLSEAEILEVHKAASLEIQAEEDALEQASIEASEDDEDLDSMEDTEDDDSDDTEA